MQVKAHGRRWPTAGRFGFFGAIVNRLREVFWGVERDDLEMILFTLHPLFRRLDVDDRGLRRLQDAALVEQQPDVPVRHCRDWTKFAGTEKKITQLSVTAYT